MKSVTTTAFFIVSSLLLTACNNSMHKVHQGENQFTGKHLISAKAQLCGREWNTEALGLINLDTEHKSDYYLKLKYQPLSAKEIVSNAAINFLSEMSSLANFNKDTVYEFRGLNSIEKYDEVEEAFILERQTNSIYWHLRERSFKKYDNTFITDSYKYEDNYREDELTGKVYNYGTSYPVISLHFKPLKFIETDQIFRSRTANLSFKTNNTSKQKIISDTLQSKNNQSVGEILKFRVTDCITNGYSKSTIFAELLSYELTYKNDVIASWSSSVALDTKK